LVTLNGDRIEKKREAEVTEGKRGMQKREEIIGNKDLTPIRGGFWGSAWKSVGVAESEGKKKKKKGGTRKLTSWAN